MALYEFSTESLIVIPATTYSSLNLRERQDMQRVSPWSHWRHRMFYYRKWAHVTKAALRMECSRRNVWAMAQYVSGWAVDRSATNTPS